MELLIRELLTLVLFSKRHSEKRSEANLGTSKSRLKSFVKPPTSRGKYAVPIRINFNNLGRTELRSFRTKSIWNIYAFLALIYVRAQECHKSKTVTLDEMEHFVLCSLCVLLIRYQRHLIDHKLKIPSQLVM